MLQHMKPNLVLLLVNEHKFGTKTSNMMTHRSLTMNKRFAVKVNPEAELIAEYFANGGIVKTKVTPKAKIKTFLNHSYRGAKARTLRNMGYAKAVA
jgi:hypothetical protein